MLVRKGNESLLKEHPFLNCVLVWDKSNKYSSMRKTIGQLRKQHYDLVVNAQRFASSGIMTWLSGAKEKRGFKSNPLSWSFSKSVAHEIGKKGEEKYQHEIERNHQLIADLVEGKAAKPRLYPSTLDIERAAKEQDAPYVCMAPASVWYTKQWHAERWEELIARITDKRIYLIGAPSDKELCEKLAATSDFAFSLAGELSLLQSASLMQGAVMNYVNDSAPMHLASAVNAPVTAIYCSTIPEFGFGPLGDTSIVWQSQQELDCRPCGLHGHQACPKGHFKCSAQIKIPNQL